MQLPSIILFVSTLLGAAMATKPLKNESQEFQLRTELVPGQTGKADFSGLYVVGYHTGAGFNAATLAKNGGNVAFLNGTKGHSGDITYKDLIFDLGSGFPWAMIPELDTVFYALWQPVNINAGDSSGKQSGYYFNNKGLQWTNQPNAKPRESIFATWLACTWWFEVPQLFFYLKEGGGNITENLPCSCAAVNLIPEYQ